MCEDNKWDEKIKIKIRVFCDDPSCGLVEVITRLKPTAVHEGLDDLYLDT